MGFFDFPSASGGGGLLGEVAKGAAQVYGSLAMAKAQKRAGKAQARDLSQAVGWGGRTGQSSRYDSLGLAGAPVPYGRAPAGTEPGIFGQGVSDWLRQNLPAGPWDIGGGDTYEKPTPYYDPTPGPWAVDDPRSQDARRTRRGPVAPSIIRTTDASGRCLEYRKRGHALITSDELAIIKRAGSTLATLRDALDGKKAPKRRRKCGAKKKRRSKRACRTLSPAQLAAGFGGAAYRRN
jgi:hypothetical protein